MIILIILICILFGICFWLIGYVNRITEAIEFQNKLNEQLGNYIIQNKEEIYKIKNSIYR